MAELSCPHEEELLPLALGETAAVEVGTHVSACPSCQQRLERLRAEVEALRRSGSPTPAADSVPDASAAAETGETSGLALRPSSADQPPTAPAPSPMMIGKYQVVEVLDNKGGQAVVYRVLHPTLRKELVLKRSRTACPADQADRAHLVAEGRLLADLNHANLARVHDLDFDQDHPFLVLEYVRGRNLLQYAHDERPGPRRSAALVAQAARGLAVPHQRGVCHLDLKPANILIDEAGRPVIIDFGMAQLRHGWTGDLADDAALGGTPAFMPPEQARGETDRVGPRSDIFALGTVLYYLLTGKVVFQGTSVLEVLARAKRCDFDRSALRAARAPRALERICLRALAPEPADRYATVQDLAADLERYVRRPRVWAGAALAAVVLLLATAGLWWGLRPPPLAPAPAGPPVVLVQRDQHLHHLPQALPVRTGDRLQVACDVPPGWPAAIFWLDSEGQLQELAEVDVNKGDTLDRLTYPRQQAFVRLRGPSGTELILVCARRSGTAPDRDEIAASLASRKRWPTLPSNTLLLLTRDKIDVKVTDSRGHSTVERGPLSEVQERLEQLRRQLRERFDFVSGVAFPFQGPEAPPLVLVRRGKPPLFELAKLRLPVPLRPGDALQVRCPVPAGFHAALFRFDAQGNFSELTPAANIAGEGFDTLRYPREGEWRLRGRSGTEFLLMCANAKEAVPSRAGIEKLFESGKPWPQLPPGVLVLLSRDRVEVRLPIGLPDQSDAVPQVRTRLEQLRRRLAEQFTVVTGLAFSVQEPEGPPVLQVHRGKERFDLMTRFGPLQPGDEMQVQCVLPSGVQASAFWLSSDGRLTDLGPARTNKGEFVDQLTVPADGLLPVPRGRTGTDFVLICGRRSEAAPRLEEVGKHIVQDDPWPPLPRTVLLLLKRDRVVTEGPLGDEADVLRVSERLEELRRKLVKEFDFVTGLAVTHQEPEKPER